MNIEYFLSINWKAYISTNMGCFFTLSQINTRKVSLQVSHAHNKYQIMSRCVFAIFFFHLCQIFLYLVIFWVPCSEIHTIAILSVFHHKAISKKIFQLFLKCRCTIAISKCLHIYFCTFYTFLKPSDQKLFPFKMHCRIYYLTQRP